MAWPDKSPPRKAVDTMDNEHTISDPSRPPALRGLPITHILPTRGYPNDPLRMPHGTPFNHPQPLDPMKTLVTRLGFAASALEIPYADTHMLKPLTMAHTLRSFEEQAMVIQNQVNRQDHGGMLGTTTVEDEHKYERLATSVNGQGQGQEELEVAVVKENKIEEGEIYETAYVETVRKDMHKHYMRQVGTPADQAGYQQAVMYLEAIETKDHSQAALSAETTFLKLYVDTLFMRNANALQRAENSMLEQVTRDTERATKAHADNNALEAKHNAQMNELKAKSAAQMSLLKIKIKRQSDEIALLKAWNEAEIEQPDTTPAASSPTAEQAKTPKRKLEGPFNDSNAEAGPIPKKPRRDAGSGVCMDLP